MNIFAWVVTVIWTGIVIGLPFFGLVSFEAPTHLNEWGDYLAGAFSPLAFLWLIMGYKQQGDELKNSIIEQKNSVKQQEEQVKILKKQLDKNLEWQTAQINQREPIFSLVLGGSNTDVKITNLGGTARSIIAYHNNDKQLINNGQFLKYNESASLKLTQTPFANVKVNINYINQQNERCVLRYIMEEDKELGWIFVLTSSK